MARLQHRLFGISSGRPQGRFPPAGYNHTGPRPHRHRAAERPERLPDASPGLQSRSGGEGQRFVATHEHTGSEAPLCRIDREAGEPFEQAFERDSGGESGDGGAKAVMGAIAETEDAVELSSYVERVPR